MIVRLREWEWCDGVALTPDQVTVLAKSDVIELRPDGANRGSWRLRARQHVGVFVVDGLEVRIQPKVRVHRLLALICESLDRVKWSDSDTSWGAASDLLATVAGSFCTHAERAVTQGLLQGYQTQHHTMFGVKGRIDMSNQLGRRAGLALPVEVIYDEYTVDITENRLLCGAAHQLLRLRSLPGTQQTRIRRLLVALNDVQPTPAQHEPPAVEFSRLNVRYRPAVTLARLILRSCSLEEVDTRDVRGSGLLVDMNKLFEDVVSEGLRRTNRTSDLTFVAQYGDHLDTHGRLKQITPDLVWTRGGQVRAVGDVKYKRPSTDGVSNEDVYQVLAYGTRYGLQDVHLIYAEPPPFERLIVAGTTIHLHNVDLECPPFDRQRGLDELAGTVAFYDDAHVDLATRRQSPS